MNYVILPLLKYCFISNNVWRQNLLVGWFQQWKHCSTCLSSPIIMTQEPWLNQFWGVTINGKSSENRSENIICAIIFSVTRGKEIASFTLKIQIKFNQSFYIFKFNQSLNLISLFIFLCQLPSSTNTQIFTQHCIVEKF